MDLGDHLTFRLIRSIATGVGGTQPAVATRRCVFACIDVDHDTVIDTVAVDVVVGATHRASRGGGAGQSAHLRRPLITHPYRLYPIADQIADKVCATMATNYPGGKASSRVKDLVDLVVLAHTQSVDLVELRAAVAAKRALVGLEEFEHFEIPPEWTRAYATTARGVPVVESLTAAAAATLVASMIDPALTEGSSSWTWTPRGATGSRVPSAQADARSVRLSMGSLSLRQLRVSSILRAPS